MFVRLPSNYWNKIENQRRFLDWLAQHLGFKQMDDWYKIRKEEMGVIGGNLLAKYTSIVQLLRTVYPEHLWQIFKFKQVPKGYWQKFENQRDFLNWLADDLGFKSLDDWYKIGNQDINKKGGSNLLKQYEGPLVCIFRAVYPQHKWSASKFNLD
jgi:hypothetical protein